MGAAVLEVRVQASLLGGESSGGIVLEQSIEEVKTVLLQPGHEGTGLLALPFGERRLVVGEGRHTRPGMFIRGAEESAGEEQSEHCAWGVADRFEQRTYRKILKISSISESPGNSGLRVHISAKIAPADHMSTPVEY